MSLLSTLSATRARKILLAAVAASAIGAGVGAPTSASAIYLPCWKTGTCKPKPFGGYGAAALAGGFALGALAAGAASAGGDDCVVEHRRAVDEDGTVFVRKVRVCD